MFVRLLIDGEKQFLVKIVLSSICEFLVFPSVSKNEAFGLIQLEAMRESKAIINTNLNTGVNFVAPHDVCAVTVTPNSFAKLAEAINLLWNNKDYLSYLSVNSHSRFNNNFI